VPETYSIIQIGVCLFHKNEKFQGGAGAAAVETTIENENEEEDDGAIAEEEPEYIAVRNIWPIGRVDSRT
jgi:hypothetical protein